MPENSHARIAFGRVVPEHVPGQQTDAFRPGVHVSTNHELRLLPLGDDGGAIAHFGDVNVTVANTVLPHDAFELLKIRGEIDVRVAAVSVDNDLIDPLGPAELEVLFDEIPDETVRARAEHDRVRLHFLDRFVGHLVQLDDALYGPHPVSVRHGLVPDLVMRESTGLRPRNDPLQKPVVVVPAFGAPLLPVCPFGLARKPLGHLGEIECVIDAGIGFGLVDSRRIVAELVLAIHELHISAAAVGARPLCADAPWPASNPDAENGIGIGFLIFFRLGHDSGERFLLAVEEFAVYAQGAEDINVIRAFVLELDVTVGQFVLAFLPGKRQRFLKPCFALEIHALETHRRLLPGR